MSMKWYVVQAYSGYENKVKLSLEERIKQAGMESHFGNILIPKENVQESRGGKPRLSSRTFYPGYIFVQMDLSDETWHLIKDTPKVNGFVGGRHPSPVPEREIAAIEQQVEEGAAKPKPRVEFEKGDHVRVTDGAFANFTGTIEEVNPEKHKVRVLVSLQKIMKHMKGTVQGQETDNSQKNKNKKKNTKALREVNFRWGEVSCRSGG